MIWTDVNFIRASRRSRPEGAVVWNSQRIGEFRAKVYCGGSLTPGYHASVHMYGTNLDMDAGVFDYLLAAKIAAANMLLDYHSEMVELEKTS